MNKTMYQPDIAERNISVYNAIMSLGNEYDNAIEVFGGALYAHKYVCDNNANIEMFV